MEPAVGGDISEYYLVGELGDISVSLVGGSLARPYRFRCGADDKQSSRVHRGLQFGGKDGIHSPSNNHDERLLTLQEKMEHVSLYSRLEAAHDHPVGSTRLGRPVVTAQHRRTTHPA